MKPKKHLLAGMIAATLSAPLFSPAFAQGEPEGLYSMDALVGSEVFLVTDDNREVGEVEDVLVAENMRVHGLVVELDEDFTASGDDEHRFVEVDQFTVATRAGDRLDRVSYAVFLTDDLAQVREYPRVDNDWWVETKRAAANIWDNTKSGASSAWQATKETTSDVIDRTKEGARDVLESLQRTLE
ncbi:MAG: PRC-barrel domain-containing protein [Pseudomonadota bacterium]